MPGTFLADDAGALLVRSGLVTASALDDARTRALELGGTIGEQLVAAEAIGDDALTEFYTARLLVPRVNPNTLARLPAKVVAVIPSDMAIELRAIPVSLDAEGNLTVAMSDPSDRHAADEIGFFTGSYVVRAVATQLQIAWCLAHYYGHVTHLGKRLLQGNADKPEAQRAISDSAARTPRKRGQTGEIAAARHHAIVPGEEASAPRPAPIEPAPRPARDTQPEDPVPEPIPRSKTASGEIKVPALKVRARSIKPPLVDPNADTVDEDPEVELVEADLVPEPSGPTITIEADEPAEETRDDPTTRTLPAPRRTRKAKTDPPELAARAGEVDIQTGRVKKIDLDEEPRVVIAEDVKQTKEVSGEIASSDGKPDRISISAAEESSAVMIHDRFIPDEAIEAPITGESQPILLDRRRPSELPTLARAAIVVDDDDEVVELSPKRPATRGDRRTQLGIGALPAATRGDKIDDDPTKLDNTVAPAADDASSSGDVLAAPPIAVRDEDTSPHVGPPLPATPKPSGRVAFDKVVARPPRDEDDDEDDVTGPVAGQHRTPATSVMTAIELDAAIPQRRAEVVPAHLDDRKTPPRSFTGAQREPTFEPDALDDGWGPPGTTIPPPLLGAIPGSVTPASGIIPIPNLDAAPLMVTPPAPPEPSRGTAAPTPQPALRALEDAMHGVLDLIRALEHTDDRDDVIALMIQHLADSHRRAGFFAVKSGELVVFAMSPRPVVLPVAGVRLDRPSTLQDVVGTRLPYRGPMLDDASRQFLASVLGACPAEILLVPVIVKERVVGVLFGEHRLVHTFDDQLGLAARAAGLALERILKAKRG